MKTSTHTHTCNAYTLYTHEDFPLPVAPMMAFRPGFIIPLRERDTKRFTVKTKTITIHS